MYVLLLGKPIHAQLNAYETDQKGFVLYIVGILPP